MYSTLHGVGKLPSKQVCICLNPEHCIQFLLLCSTVQYTTFSFTSLETCGADGSAVNKYITVMQSNCTIDVVGDGENDTFLAGDLVFNTSSLIIDHSLLYLSFVVQYSTVVYHKGKRRSSAFARSLECLYWLALACHPRARNGR